MSRDDIRRLEPVEQGLYESLPLADLAAYGMFRIEQMAERLTIENLCVVLFRLFPEKFSMLGFPEYPDGMRINRTLLQMQPKYRNYATGSAKKGYELSDVGRSVAAGLERYFMKRAQSTPTGNRKSHVTASDDNRSFTDDKLVRQIQHSDLYTKYVSGEFKKARGIEFLAMLKAFAHTPKKELTRRFNECRTAAKNLDDKELLKFLDSCKKKYEMLLK